MTTPAASRICPARRRPGKSASSLTAGFSSSTLPEGRSRPRGFGGKPFVRHLQVAPAGEGRRHDLSWMSRPRPANIAAGTRRSRLSAERRRSAAASHVHAQMAFGSVADRKASQAAPAPPKSQVQDLRRPISHDAPRRTGGARNISTDYALRVAGRRPLYLAAICRPAIHGRKPRKIRAADFPGPDPGAAALLGGAGLRAAAALRHGSGRRHFPHGDFPARARPGAVECRLRAAEPEARPTAATATTRSGSSITTSSRSS